MEPKKQITVRLDPATVRELEALAKRHRISQAKVMSLLIHAHYTDADPDELERWFEIAHRN